MTANDLPQVIAIEQESFSRPWTREHFEAELRKTQAGNGVSLVLDDADGVAGYVCASGAAGEWDLGVIAVAGRARNQGAGRNLLDALLHRGEKHDIDAVFLEVRESNAVARKLYEGAGFNVVGRREGYYQKPDEDALVYRWDRKAATKSPPL